MDLSKNLILAKGQVITPEIETCEYNSNTNKYMIQYKSGKVFSYNFENVAWIKNPTALNPKDFEICHNGKTLYKVKEIYEFPFRDFQYWHICFENNSHSDYEKKDLVISKSCLADKKSKKVFDYLKETADHVSLQTEEGTKLLSKQFEKVDFIAEGTAFSSYVNPGKYQTNQYNTTIPIFPFGCNASQYKAVKAALENQLSIIEGPPGTGKTQTILNIIANLIIAGKTVQIVSNNNSATANVFEKLCSYDLGFIAAPLGKRDNKKIFIEEQTGLYPEVLKSWNYGLPNSKDFLANVQNRSIELNELFINQQHLFSIKQDFNDLETEYHYFLKYLEESGKNYSPTIIRKPLTSDILLNLWHECQMFYDKQKKLSLFFKIKCRFIYGISVWTFYQKEPFEVTTLVQYLFYTTKKHELQYQINQIETLLADSNMEVKSKELQDISMLYLKSKLFSRYSNKSQRDIFNDDDLWKNPKLIQAEYPVILSTTFSARSSLCSQAKFDYLIIDEASQVDVATGALALSCAENAVIVGDIKQLPNVITEKDKKSLQLIFDSYSLNSGYNFAAKSLLQSICDIIPGLPRTLLREHYRCHPKIINFCNQKFYDGNLVIMTKDNEEKDVISVIKTVVGNHVRDHMNQRQIDIITQEILPSMSCANEDIGIIAPYNDQVEAITTTISDQTIEVATVHKFQGREKDAIIISTVDDLLTDFTDDPNLLNVAVSRAKKSLQLIVSGNDQQKQGNISDLIDYIEYHNFTIRQSTIHSVFDFLYRHYTERRLEILNSRNRISEYDSENLMYLLINDVLQNINVTGLQVICHQPLNMLIRDYTCLNDEDRKYALHCATHLDFLIFNRINKKPVLAIEVDGYKFHKKGTVQAQRDKKKDHILELYEIPLLRLATNGSNEREKIKKKLDTILSVSL